MLAEEGVPIGAMLCALLLLGIAGAACASAPRAPRAYDDDHSLLAEAGDVPDGDFAAAFRRCVDDDAACSQRAAIALALLVGRLQPEVADAAADAFEAKHAVDHPLARYVAQMRALSGDAHALVAFLEREGEQAFGDDLYALGAAGDFSRGEQLWALLREPRHRCVAARAAAPYMLASAYPARERLIEAITDGVRHWDAAGAACASKAVGIVWATLSDERRRAVLGHVASSLRGDDVERIDAVLQHLAWWLADMPDDDIIDLLLMQSIVGPLREAAFVQAHRLGLLYRRIEPTMPSPDDVDLLFAEEPQARGGLGAALAMLPGASLPPRLVQRMTPTDVIEFYETLSAEDAAKARVVEDGAWNAASVRLAELRYLRRTGAKAAPPVSGTDPLRASALLAEFGDAASTGHARSMLADIAGLTHEWSQLAALWNLVGRCDAVPAPTQGQLQTRASRAALIATLTQRAAECAR